MSAAVRRVAVEGSVTFSKASYSLSPLLRKTARQSSFTAGLNSFSVIPALSSSSEYKKSI